MRLLNLSFLSFLSLSAAQAQTVPETVDWINGKLTAFPITLTDGTQAEQSLEVIDCEMRYFMRMNDGYINDGEAYFVPLAQVSTIALTYEQGIRGMQDVTIVTSDQVIRYAGPLVMPAGRLRRSMHITVGGDHENVPARLKTAIKRLVESCGGNTNEPY